MNMQMSEVMVSSPHYFPFILYTEMTKISYLSYENVRLALKHKDSFGKFENLSKKKFAEILVFDHDYEGKS